MYRRFAAAVVGVLKLSVAKAHATLALLSALRIPRLGPAVPRTRRKRAAAVIFAAQQPGAAADRLAAEFLVNGVGHGIKLSLLVMILVVEQLLLRQGIGLQSADTYAQQPYGRPNAAYCTSKSAEACQSSCVTFVGRTSVRGRVTVWKSARRILICTVRP